MATQKKSWGQAFTSLFVETDSEPVSTDSIDIDALLAGTSSSDLPDVDFEAPSAPAPPPIPPQAAAPPPVAAPAAGPRLEIGQPLKEFYTNYGVPASPKTVEEIILFLQGLQGMPQTVQNQALKAMDEADPNWTLADVVLDGRYKIDALAKAKLAVDQQVQAVQASAAAEVAEHSAYLDNAQNTISAQIASLQEQIAELEELLVAEKRSVATQQAAAEERAASIALDARTEHERIDNEIKRITRIVDVFGPMAQEP